MGPILTVFVDVIAESIYERVRHHSRRERAYAMPSWSKANRHAARICRLAVAQRLNNDRSHAKPEQPALI